LRAIAQLYRHIHVVQLKRSPVAGIPVVANPIIAVGASSGGLGPLRRITEQLPRNCGATLFVVMHAGADSLLPQILSWHGKLRVEFACNGERIKPGRIYVAPSDFHMRVGAGLIRLDQGPKVHNARPAVDPLFASVAITYGKQAMGIVLSGAGDDGGAGLIEIEKHGGSVLVQDPREAASPSMPEAAIAADDPECLSIDDIAIRVRDLPIPLAA
jgi:two-component system chemotaxis response regulator CheB